VNRDNIIDIEWKDRKLARLTQTDAGGRRKFGDRRWSVMKRRLQVLYSAETLADARGVGGLHLLTGDRAGSYAMNLDGAYRLVFRPEHEPPPQLGTGGIDDNAVTAIVILEVVNYHD
jgi:proteic killer suppression protein